MIDGMVPPTPVAKMYHFTEAAIRIFLESESTHQLVVEPRAQQFSGKKKHIQVKKKHNINIYSSVSTHQLEFVASLVFLIYMFMYLYL